VFDKQKFASNIAFALYFQSYSENVNVIAAVQYSFHAVSINSLNARQLRSL